MTVHEDKWLSQILDRPSFRADVQSGPALSAAVAEIEEHAQGQRSAFYFAKIDTAEVDAVRRLGAIGFYTVDVNVTFELRQLGPLYELPPPVDVGGLTAASKDRVLDIAGSCFRYSRFHLDPLVPSALAHRVKREWVKSYAEGRRGDHLFVAHRDGRPAGFLAALFTETDGKKSAVIDLVGVSAESQKKRAGESLVVAFARHYRDRAASFLVGTQAANIPSVRLYEKLGFRLSKSQYVLHMHVGTPLKAE